LPVEEPVSHGMPVSGTWFSDVDLVGERPGAGVGETDRLVFTPEFRGAVRQGGGSMFRGYGHGMGLTDRSTSRRRPGRRP
jgi:hypothetical protein